MNNPFINPPPSSSSTTPSAQSSGPRSPSFAPSVPLESAVDSEEADQIMKAGFQPSGLLPTSTVPQPPRPSSATLAYALPRQTATSPYFPATLDSSKKRVYTSSSSNRTEIQTRTSMFPQDSPSALLGDDGLPSAHHVENAGFEAQSRLDSPMDQDGLPDYEDSGPTVNYDDKSQVWDPAYREPEALPPSPAADYQLPIQDVRVWNSTAEAEGASSWATATGTDHGGWADTPPPPLISIEDTPHFPQIGPGVLPSVLMERPVWPIDSPAWEIVVDNLPVPSIPPPLPPLHPVAPFSSSSNVQLVDVSNPGPSSTDDPSADSSPPEVASPPPKIEPPNIKEIRDALPQIPRDGGAVVFCPKEMAWWVFPAGFGMPSEEKFVEEARLKAYRFHCELEQYRKSSKGIKSSDWEEDKLTSHYHLFENAILPGSFYPELDLPAISPEVPLSSFLPPPRVKSKAFDSEMESPVATAPETPTGSDTQTRTLTSSDSDPTTPPNTSPPLPVPAEFPPSSVQRDNLYLAANDQNWVVIPRHPVQKGVLDSQDVEAFSRSKVHNPPPGVQDGVDAAWTVILTMIINFLFGGQTRAIKISNPGFAAKVGWDEHSRAILLQLGFESTVQSSPNGDEIVVAPLTEPSALLAMRTRLIRAWVEISAYLEDHRRQRYLRENPHAPVGEALPPTKGEKHVGHIKLVSPENGYFGRSTGIEAIPKRSPRHWTASSYTDALASLGINRNKFQVPSIFVIFAYKMQTRFDAVNTPRYLQALETIIADWVQTGKDDLQTLLVTERSAGLVTSKEIEDAYALFPDLSKETAEKICVDQSEFPHDWITKQFWFVFNNLGATLAEGASLTEAKAVLIHALEVIWTDRKNDIECAQYLKMAIEQAKREPPTPDEAYKMLEIPKDTDDDMVLAMFEIRLQDQPTKIYEWKDALKSIANARNSDMLRRTAEAGHRVSDVTEVEAVSADRPVGLNNVGNTCYLNSLLQYFYTIKEFRETVCNYTRFQEELKDDLEKRVGGRAVSRKEIERSIRFTDYLSRLFSNLELSDTSSISPDLELAYLALVTSKDEEAETPIILPSTTTTTTGTSPDTDTTLVDESSAVPAPPANSPTPLPVVAEPGEIISPSTVLGKRTSEDRDLMDVDSRPGSRSATTIPEEIDSAMDGGSDHSSRPSVSPAHSPVLSPLSPSRKALRQDSSLSASASRSTRAMTIEPEANIPSVVPEQPLESSSTTPVAPPVGLVTFPPKLPPRPVTKPSADGPMMFGKQHDVSECLDNCLFQIEAAMDPLKLQDSVPGGANLVKQLFYGKARQTLHFEGDLKASLDHDKEVIFNHILLNVGETGTSKDLYDGLSDYYTPELVDIEGKKASIEEVPVEFPRLLHVQLQRAQFDRETSRAYKSNAFVSFPETLKMDRYSEEADPAKREASRAKTTEIKNLRERVDALKNSGKRPFTEALATLVEDLFPSQDWLPSTQIDDELKADLERSRGEISIEIIEAEQRIKTLKQEVEEIWKGDADLEYELSSVFMHRGDASFGHYFLYQRNLPSKPESWFKYNDASVTTVPANEVLADTTGTNANPYLLVYARKDQGLVDTVKRTIFT